MTQHIFPKNDSDSSLARSQYSRTKGLDAEVIRALTPLFIAAIGGVIGITVLVIGSENTAAFGLASTAIAGGAGLAQPNQNADKK